MSQPLTIAITDKGITIEGNLINESIFDGAKASYRPVLRDDEILNIADMICEAPQSDKLLILEDIKELQSNEDEIVLSSLDTNHYIYPSGDINAFNEQCQDIIEASMDQNLLDAFKLSELLAEHSNILSWPLVKKLFNLSLVSTMNEVNALNLNWHSLKGSYAVADLDAEFAKYIVPFEAQDCYYAVIDDNLLYCPMNDDGTPDLEAIWDVDYLYPSDVDAVNQHFGTEFKAHIPESH